MFWPLLILTILMMTAWTVEKQIPVYYRLLFWLLFWLLLRLLFRPLLQFLLLSMSTGFEERPPPVACWTQPCDPSTECLPKQQEQTLYGLGLTAWNTLFAGWVPPTSVSS